MFYEHKFILDSKISLEWSRCSIKLILNKNTVFLLILLILGIFRNKTRRFHALFIVKHYDETDKQISNDRSDFPIAILIFPQAIMKYTACMQINLDKLGMQPFIIPHPSERWHLHTFPYVDPSIKRARRWNANDCVTRRRTRIR